MKQTRMFKSNKNVAQGGKARGRTSKFQIHETVLAKYAVGEDEELLYEAKVLQIEQSSNMVLVHYKGWNKTYDEWLHLDRLLKDNQKHRKMKEEYETLQKMKKKAAKKKKQKDGSAEAEPSTEKNPAPVGLFIPKSLKRRLRYDWEYTVNLDKLVELPKSHTVREMASMYEEHKRSRAPYDVRIMDKLCGYFDRVLPSSLVYGMERQQFEEEVKGKHPPSMVYGVEHLLRVFVRLPSLFYQGGCKEENILQIMQTAGDFLKFIAKNESKFYPSERSMNMLCIAYESEAESEPLVESFITYERRKKKSYITYEWRKKKARI